MTGYRGLMLLVAPVVFSAASLRASDRWEGIGGSGNSDDDSQTYNQLRHGSVQIGHDLEGTPGNVDQDWMLVRVLARHSYEAKVSDGGPVRWDSHLFTSCTANCPKFDRVDVGGTVIQAGVPGPDDLDHGSTSSGLTVRWIAPTDGTEYLRAIGDQLLAQGTDDNYDVSFYDTTCFVPRWNNSATQTTIFLIQSTVNTVVAGEIYFYDAAGTLLSTQPLSVPAQGLQALNVASIPALAGKSGAAAIAQLGGYGAIVGKAVALEPATGFTFDTAILPLPH